MGILKSKLKQGLVHAVLMIGMAAALFPFLWMALGSVKTYKEMLLPRFFPTIWTLDNYREILTRVGFLTAFKNSALVAIPATAMVLFTSAAAGYVFAKYHFWGKEVLFTILLSTMMVPFTVVVIPLFITMNDLGLVNKLTGILITSLCSTFGIFLMRQAIMVVPNDYVEAARIDGASEFWIFSRVVIPLVRPSLATLAVFTFLGNWDSYMWPSIMLRTASRQTLPVVIAGMRNLYVVRYQIWAAGSMLTVVPVMILFTLAQKQFVRGMTLSGLKG